jgi:ABC-type branched-subunit amino acid transport system substrate-binding protein
MKKLFAVLGLLSLSVGVIACDPTVVPSSSNSTTTSSTTSSVDSSSSVKPKVEVQGVTDTTIKVGNTAATSGGYSAIGVPFNDLIKAVFKEVNDKGGIGGRTIEFVTYDDQFDAVQGKAYTEKLIEEDKVFALVGHFGTPTVGATINMIQDYGLPMVYAATGINALYFEESVGNPVLAVQPIYKTDGRLMTARAIKEKLYGANQDQALPANAKIGVLYTNDDVGNSIKEGVTIEAAKLGKTNDMTYEIVSDLDTAKTAILKFQMAGVQSIILAMNQVPFAYSLTALHQQQFNVPVFTSYVNADVTAVDHTQYHVDRPIYTNAWVDVYSTSGQLDVLAFVDTVNQADLDLTTKYAYYSNSFAIAGYIAAKVFVEGLKRVEEAGVDLTFASYIAAMENGPINIPMGGTVDFSNGHRWGIDSMSLLKYGFTLGDNPATTDVVETDFPTEAFTKVREIETIAVIEAK